MTKRVLCEAELKDFISQYRIRYNTGNYSNSLDVLVNCMSDIRGLEKKIEDLTLECVKLKNKADSYVENQVPLFKKRGRPPLTDEEKELKAIERGDIQKIYTIHLEYLDATIEKGECELVKKLPELKKKLDYLALRKKEKAKKFAYAQITICPDPKKEVEFDELVKKMDKFLEKQWVDEIYWSYEQTCDDPLRPDEWGKGFHLNFLVKTNKKPYCEVKRETHSTFKTLIGDKTGSKNKGGMNIKCVEKSKMKHSLAYILGYKNQKGETPDKIPKVYVDYLWKTRDYMDFVEYKNPREDVDLTTFIEAEFAKNPELKEELDQYLPQDEDLDEEVYDEEVDKGKEVLDDDRFQELDDEAYE